MVTHRVSRQRIQATWPPASSTHRDTREERGQSSEAMQRETAPWASSTGSGAWRHSSGGGIPQPASPATTARTSAPIRVLTRRFYPDSAPSSRKPAPVRPLPRVPSTLALRERAGVRVFRAPGCTRVQGRVWSAEPWLYPW
ncbi:Hypothetical protein AA314_01185 [Archangium gephyra]|uniref:Uncharacterized protein n=1 Tax=Archangium gephyra TaxID=48 RepID=A0AAC8Q377_9BACT|nr:Hypothetical protein AA314_01185 [Archangium gephyra]